MWTPGSVLSSSKSSPEPVVRSKFGANCSVLVAKPEDDLAVGADVELSAHPTAPIEELDRFAPQDRGDGLRVRVRGTYAFVQ
jgi:hypothetical protein